MSKNPIIVFEGIEGSGKSFHINFIEKHLKKDDVIMTINNIPVGKINDIYNIYKDEDLKQFDLEILRKEKLILVEWYR